MMAANQPPNDAITIGIDFGTTFSGVAWTYSREPDDIELVTSWDAEMRQCSDVEKAPTQLLCDGDGEGISWGYAIPPDKEPLKWFKLLLIDRKDLPAEIARSSKLQEARNLCNQIYKGPVEIIASFLRCLWIHSLESIKRTIGADMLSQFKLQVVITLPAIWPPYAQQRMRHAAQQSGILDARPTADATTLNFISEPEAAALATIKDLARLSAVNTGDTIVVCDAGGGTVDLISYVFESTEPFVVKECAKGDGDLCGGVFLDEAFLRLVKGKSPQAIWDSVSKADEKKFLNDHWEHTIKPQFENQQRIWPVELPDSCYCSSSRGLRRRVTLELKSTEILSVFSPIARKIEALVNRQVDAILDKYNEGPKYIILVGGFGRSRYLFARLRERFGSTVLQSRGNKPWTAICRGAVIHGLTRQSLYPSIGIKIEARVARKSYGTDFDLPFVEGTHDERDRRWNEINQEYQATRQMHWFLKEGDDVSRRRSIRHDYMRLYPEDAIDAGYIAETIYCATTSPPSSRREDTTVERLCQIEWTRNIATEMLPTYINSIGQVFRELTFQIQMDCDDGMVNFSVYHNGMEVGAQNVEVSFD
ncbi:hypothetical protein FSARC_5588 [Fusarium sarcochroum]|uniref:Hsp70 protein n=1 Tax=Fusarium sarcochroum TaxID=1208366 RepID=A0A8H4TZ19_9HYPO|nr:hypothetical protein FSARC_5588 [Fusarium sarcochroum]